MEKVLCLKILETPLFLEEVLDRVYRGKILAIQALEKIVDEFLENLGHGIRPGNSIKIFKVLNSLEKRLITAREAKEELEWILAKVEKSIPKSGL